MGRTAHQRERRQGSKVGLFTGLAEVVNTTARSIQGVENVHCVGVIAYRGEQRVKMTWGKGAPLIVKVSDADHGERRLRIEAKRHGAVSRILRKELTAMGISVPKTKRVAIQPATEAKG